ncbi:MAG: hypothetical protein ACYTEL_27225 [Planctomycetota bacterium]
MTRTSLYRRMEKYGL